MYTTTVCAKSGGTVKRSKWRPRGNANIAPDAVRVRSRMRVGMGADCGQQRTEGSVNMCICLGLDVMVMAGYKGL